MLMGSPQKTIQECEKAGELVIRRAIVAKRDMKKSEIITWEDILWVRPANGLGK